MGPLFHISTPNPTKIYRKTMHKAFENLLIAFCCYASSSSSSLMLMPARDQRSGVKTIANPILIVEDNVTNVTRMSASEYPNSNIWLISQFSRFYHAVCHQSMYK